MKNVIEVQTETKIFTRTYASTSTVHELVQVKQKRNKKMCLETDQYKYKLYDIQVLRTIYTPFALDVTQ